MSSTSNRPLTLHPDRLFSAEPIQREHRPRALHAEIAELPLLCPHGHTDPRWFADDEPFDNPAALLVTPDHYLIRMLYSQGVPLEALGIAAARRVGDAVVAGPRDVWRTFADHFHLFRGTPSGLWIEPRLAATCSASTCDSPPRRPTRPTTTSPTASPTTRSGRRALLDRFGIEVVATTDSAH